MMHQIQINAAPVRPPTPARGWLAHEAGRTRAFTLIELITVMGIMVILMGVAVPSFNKIMKGNAQGQGANMVTAYLASARATALNSRRPTAVVFYTDKLNPAQIAIGLGWQAQSADDNGSVITLTAVPGRDPEFLPKGVKVATLNDATGAGGLQIEDATATPPARVVLFSGAGQMLLSKVYSANTTWGLRVGDASSPGVLIYDERALVDSGKTGAAQWTWLQSHADLLIVNAFTGNVIR